MLRIGDLELKGRVFLAPMAGVTDFAFRALCLRQGAALVTTEMVSARALVYRDAKTKELLYIPEDGHPCAVQLFGHEPEILAEAAPLALELSGADAVDLNMGCPVGKVVRSGDGSALMKDPELAGRIVEAVRAAVPARVPVTVKFRKGWDGGSVNAAEFAKVCEQAGASMLTVHGRTRVQMYAGRADREIIREVVKAVSVPVVANGDIFSAEDAVQLLRTTGAAACAVGRGAFGDPWLFARADAALRGEPVPEPPPLSERMETALGQIEELARMRGERQACLEARHHMPWYLHGVPHSAVYRSALVRISTLDELRRTVREIKADRRLTGRDEA